MVRARWRNRFGPPTLMLGLALLLTAAITASAALAASRRPGLGSVGQCAVPPAKAARAALRNDFGARSVARTEQRLGRGGELIGRTLHVYGGTDGAVEIQLPVESFVGRRQGNSVVYTRAGGGRASEVHVVDLVTGCDTVIARPPGVVRSAILSPDASAVYVHSVSPRSRADAGVTRHDLESGAATTAVPALTPPERIGRIFGTQLAWNLNGDRLTVQSCGFAECVTRVLHVASDELTAVDAPGQGALIGTTDSTLVTYASCPGLPCAVIAHDVAAGTLQVLSDEAYETSIRRLPNGQAAVSMNTAEGPVEISL